MECVVIGGGVAGMQAAFSCRRHWPDTSVTLIDAEPEVGYYRTLLPQFMVRRLAENKLFFWRQNGDPKLSVRTGIRVESVDRGNRKVILANKEKLTYDRLVIASGGRPIIPGMCVHCPSEGIFPVRNLTSARMLQKWLPEHPRIVILGGGLVGVKTAVHLARPEFSVTLVEKENQLLPQALSLRTAGLVAAHLERKNINLILGNSVEDIQVKGNEIAAVQVDGKWLQCQTLLVAAGSIPDIHFLQDTGLLENEALLVSTALQTKDRNIFAAGDAVTVASGDGVTPWTWPQAVTQGKLAGLNVYSAAPAALNCFTRVNSMNLDGLSLIILGAPVPEAEVFHHADVKNGIYREIFYSSGRIVGGALIGDISSAGGLHSMINTGRIVIDDEDLPKPSVRAFRQNCLRDVSRKRRIRYI